MKTFSKILASCLGLGYFPLAPGTLTSLAVVLIYKFYLSVLTWPVHLVIFFVLFFAGIMTSSRVSADSKKKDPRNIVIDEAAGQYLCLFRLSPSWLPVVLSFLLFRIFDIIKPFPIRKVEALTRGWGIMLDDIAAALYAGIIVYAYLLLK
ncbi:MAG: phosphatidylglycerophosphatase A [Candidatus Aminicenantes bacterium]